MTRLAFIPRRMRSRPVAVGTALAALGVMTAIASGSTPVLLAGTGSDPAGDASAGMDIAALSASYSKTSGTLITTVTMAQRPTSGKRIDVVFGVGGADTTCDTSGPSVRFTAGESVPGWTAPGTFASPGFVAPTERTVPKASTTMSSGITVNSYRGKSYDCATAITSDSGVTPVDTATTSLRTVPDGRVPVTPKSRTVIQLDYGYGGGERRSATRIPVRVTCLVSPSRRCGGRLTLVQQRTHLALGTTRFTLTLGTSRKIGVPVRLSARLRRLATLETKVTVTPTHGDSAWTVFNALH